MLRRAAFDAARLAAGRVVQQYSASTGFAAAPEFQTNVWKAEPCSLEHGRPIETARDETMFKRMLLRLFGFYTRESRLLRGAKALHAAVQEQAENPALYEALGLERRFANTHALLCLHVWMTLVRLRGEGRDGKDLAQMLYESFQDNVEHRVRAEGVKVRISKWLKDLEMMFYGSSLAYDKALQGEGELPEALLRNVYGNDPAAAPAARALARYVQRELSCLALTNSAAIMTGQLQFSGASLPAGPLGSGESTEEVDASEGAGQEKGHDADLQQQYAG
ncbi:hypothetical protein WJX81_003307 [Elliptochloris bilobata]|uniref:Ubiquinol-cytochrome c chaperone domain-containing protein n=1 Tax=Elliptochloris bilobata TaxID=381761 RepID=A0AAW1SLJ4_9CHLO